MYMHRNITMKLNWRKYVSISYIKLKSEIFITIFKVYEGKIKHIIKN